MISAIIQARMGSSRLPGKTLKKICGKPLLWHIVNRVKKAKLIDNVIIATTTNDNDNLIVEWAEQNDILYFRGDENNVLKRYYDTAVNFNANVIVRITADDPFKDSEIIDRVIKLLLETNADFACNNNPPSFPEGLDTEVFTFNALQIAFKKAEKEFDREHVTQYFYRNTELFKMVNLKHDINISHLRWTIDTDNDFKFAQKVYKHLYKEGVAFNMEDILSLLNTKPELLLINNNETRSEFYKNIDL